MLNLGIRVWKGQKGWQRIWNGLGSRVMPFQSHQNLASTMPAFLKNYHRTILRRSFATFTTYTLPIQLEAAWLGERWGSRLLVVWFGLICTLHSSHTWPRASYISNGVAVENVIRLALVDYLPSCFQVAEKILNKKELEFYKWDGDLSQLLQNVREKLNKVADVSFSVTFLDSFNLPKSFNSFYCHSLPRAGPESRRTTVSRRQRSRSSSREIFSVWFSPRNLQAS